MEVTCCDVDELTGERPHVGDVVAGRLEGGCRPADRVASNHRPWEIRREGAADARATAEDPVLVLAGEVIREDETRTSAVVHEHDHVVLIDGVVIDGDIAG